MLSTTTRRVHHKRREIFNPQMIVKPGDDATDVFVLSLVRVLSVAIFTAIVAYHIIVAKPSSRSEPAAVAA